ncbi:MAG: hypothetical protein KIT17_21950 [Rubrivivax sp.]|nr:hypothetical protein [Rubrivivax sp.]
MRIRRSRSAVRAGAAALAVAGGALLTGLPADAVASAVATGAVAPRAADAAPPATATATPAAPSASAAPKWQRAAAKHGGSGVTLRYAVPDKLAVGETVAVRLQFGGVTAADGAAVEVIDAATRAPLLTLQLQSGEQRTAELSYTGRSDGMQFLTVTTTQAGRVTVQQVPLRVGSGELKLKAEGQRRSTAGGEAVISLPASAPK